VAAALAVGVSVLAFASVARAEDPALQEQAADLYAAHYGVSMDVAYQQLDLQDAANAALSDVTDALGSSYAGSWYEDPANGGRLEIAVNDLNQTAGSIIDQSDPLVQDAASALDAAAVGSSTDFVAEPLNLNVLLAVLNTLVTSLNDLLMSGQIQIAIDYATNSVVVDTIEGLTFAARNEIQQAIQQLPQSDNPRVQDALANSPDGVVAHPQATAITSYLPQSASCEFLGLAILNFCDAPPRGGGGIFSDNGTGCTIGFLVWNNALTTPYFLTAGHCLHDAAGGAWTTYTAAGVPVTIGHGQSTYKDGPNGDYGLININNPSSLGIHCCGTYIWVGRNSGGDTTLNETYPINRAADPPAGSEVCTSSMVPLPPSNFHTSCGFLLKGITSTGGVGHLRAATYCTARGASGGPVYKNNLGYGTNVAFLKIAGACVTYYMPTGTSGVDPVHPFHLL
jgi:hypothetical protein